MFEITWPADHSDILNRTNAQSIRIRVVDLLQRGEIDVDEANVRMIDGEGVRIVHHLPRQVRAALNAAVKAGRLGHMKKDGRKPEVYFRVQQRHIALQIREREEKAALVALSKVYARP